MEIIHSLHQAIDNRREHKYKEFKIPPSVANISQALIEFNKTENHINESKEKQIQKILTNSCIIKACTIGLPKEIKGQNLKYKSTLSSALIDVILSTLLMSLDDLDYVMKEVSNGLKAYNFTPEFTNSIYTLSFISSFIQTLSTAASKESNTISLIFPISVDLEVFQQTVTKLQGITNKANQIKRSGCIEEYLAVPLVDDIQSFIPSIESSKECIILYIDQLRANFSNTNYIQFGQFYEEFVKYSNFLTDLFFIGLEISFFVETSQTFFDNIVDLSNILIDFLNIIHPLANFKSSNPLLCFTAQVAVKKILSRSQSIEFKEPCKDIFQTITNNKVSDIKSKLNQLQPNIKEHISQFLTQIQKSKLSLLCSPITADQFAHKKLQSISKLIQLTFLYVNSVVVNGYSTKDVEGLISEINEYYDKIDHNFVNQINEKEKSTEYRISCLQKRNTLKFSRELLNASNENYARAPLNSEYRISLMLSSFNSLNEQCLVDPNSRAYEYLSRTFRIFLEHFNTNIVSGACILTYKRFLQILIFITTTYISQFFTLLQQQIQIAKNIQSLELDSLNSKLRKYLRTIRHPIICSPNFQLSSNIISIVNQIKKFIDSIQLTNDDKVLKKSIDTFNVYINDLTYYIDNSNKYIWNMNGQELLGSYERAKDKISKLMEQIEHQQQDSSYVMTQLAMSIYEFTSLSKLFQNAPTDIINIIEGNISIVINICINYELGDESCKYEILNAKNEIEKNLLKMESFVKGYQQNIPLNDVNSPEIAYAMSQFDESLLIKNDESSSQDDKGYIKLAKSWSNKLRDYIKGCSNSMLSGSIHHGSVGSLGDLGVPTLYNVNSFVSFQISNHSSDHSLGGRSPPDNMLEDVPIHNKNVKNVINQQQQKPPAAQQPPKPPTAQQSAPKNVTITQQPPKPASVQQQTPPTKNVTTAQQAPQPPKPATVPQPAPQQAPQPASNAPAQQQKSVTTSTAHQTPQPSQPPPATATTANQTQQPPDLSRKPTPVPMQAPTIIQPSPVVAITPTPTAAAVNVPSATPKIIQIPATQQYILPPPSKPPLPPPKQSMPPPKQPFAGGGTSIDVSLAPAPSLSMFKKPVGPNTQKK